MATKPSAQFTEALKQPYAEDLGPSYVVLRIKDLAHVADETFRLRLDKPMVRIDYSTAYESLRDQQIDEELAEKAVAKMAKYVETQSLMALLANRTEVL